MDTVANQWRGLVDDAMEEEWGNTKGKEGKSKLPKSPITQRTHNFLYISYPLLEKQKKIDRLNAKLID